MIEILWCVMLWCGWVLFTFILIKTGWFWTMMVASFSSILTKVGWSFIRKFMLKLFASYFLSFGPSGPRRCTSAWWFPSPSTCSMRCVSCSIRSRLRCATKRIASSNGCVMCVFYFIFLIPVVFMFFQVFVCSNI